MSAPEPSAANTDRRPLPQYGEYAPPGYVSPVPVQAVSPAPDSPAVSQAGKRPRDATATVLLLGLGSAVTTFMVMSAFRFDEVMQQLYDTYALGTYAPNSALTTAGALFIVSHVAALAIGAVIALRRMRHGKSSFWVALIAGAIAATCYVAITVTLILSDPLLTEALTASQAIP
jgi:uncharacterized membrane protein YhaH (DUF805 family)